MFKVRPWGFWVIVFQAVGVKVKILFFKPGKSISMQKHLMRSEKWRVLFGSGVLCRGGGRVPRKMSFWDRAYIDKNMWHVFTAGNWPCVILEIQEGVCREDDIVRM